MSESRIVTDFMITQIWGKIYIICVIGVIPLIHDSDNFIRVISVISFICDSDIFIRVIGVIPLIRDSDLLPSFGLKKNLYLHSTVLMCKILYPCLILLL